MRISTSVLHLVLLAACGAQSAPQPPGTDTDTDPVLPEPPDDTAVPLADEGSLMLTRKVSADGTKTVQLYGLFVDEHSGYVNAAQCAVTKAPCFDYLPTDEDDYLDMDLERVFAPELSEFRYVGLDVGFGEWSAPYVNGPQFPYYYVDLTPTLGTEDIRGWFGARYGGQWGDYEGTKDIYVSPDIELIFPRPDTSIPFHDGENLVIEWVPDGKGTIFLTVTELGLNATLARLYMLEDDGYFELSIDDLGLGQDEVNLNFNLARWNWGSVTKKGNRLDLVATSEASFTGNYFYVGGREPLELSDKCLPASTMPPLEPGSYWGELGDVGFDNDLSDTDDCTNGDDANGADGFIRVEVEPLQFLGATYTLLEDDASIYIVRDCLDANTCVSGADENDETLPESVSFFNETDETQVVYLALDGGGTSIGLYNLDVTLDTLQEPDMYNTCPEAMQQPTATTAGTYYTSYLPYTNSVDPGAGGCTGTGLVGPDSMTLVTLQAGETLTASITMEGADPALYLLYNCNVVNSCAEGKDSSLGSKETVVYQNTSGASENLYLVVDTKGAGLKPYFLTLDIN